MEISTTVWDEDDIVRELLVRLDDEAALLRCVVTCKRWRRIVADPDFLLRWHR
jgi:hypothetical protein